uniref:Glutaredoxin domain-containing protein n=1 Tax=Caenorhabditis tropicalis TaxID=1561998 RepID=A0A1I7U2B6_9PELO
MTTENFGPATYVPGRHRKNPVLVYTSRKDRNKVYEFMIATRYKVAGLVSWKCVSCAKVKNGYRNLGAELKRKVPLILVDNDIIKEDPERPLNAEHFCNGKDAVDAVLDRARLEFVHQHGDKEPGSSRIHEEIHDFAREAASSTPIQLSLKEKKLVQRTLDANCLTLLHGVSKRRRWKQQKEAEENLNREQELKEGSDPAKSDGPPVTKKSKVEAEEAAEIVKKRGVQKPKMPLPQTVMVRPLPPYPQHSAPRYHHPEQYHSFYYVSEEVVEFNNEELIAGDQQQVAYSIEL